MHTYRLGLLDGADWKSEKSANDASAAGPAAKNSIISQQLTLNPV